MLNAIATYRDNVLRVKTLGGINQALGSIVTVAIDLSDIVDRRNRIAHESDIDPTYPKARWPISKSDVDGTIDFLNDVVETIHTMVL